MLIAKEHKGSFGGNGNVLYLVVVVVTRMCTFGKTHKTVHCKWVPFVVCKLYFPEGVQKKVEPKFLPPKVIGLLYILSSFPFIQVCKHFPQLG